MLNCGLVPNCYITRLTTLTKNVRMSRSPLLNDKCSAALPLISSTGRDVNKNINIP